MGSVGVENAASAQLLETLYDGQPPTGREFLEAIDRTDVIEVLSPKHPWAFNCLELYLEGQGFPGNGGLGILESDKVAQVRRNGIPAFCITNSYPQKIEQSIIDLHQQTKTQAVHPEEHGAREIGQTKILANGDIISVKAYKAEGYPIVGLCEPGLKELYHGSNDGEHRAYQQTILGFGGADVLRQFQCEPSVIQLDESSAVNIALAWVDKYCSEGSSIDEALNLTRQKTVLTNHTLVQAAVASFSKEMFERYVFKNLQSKELKKWLSGLIDKKGGSLNLSTLAATLAGKANGVSHLHARLASGQFFTADGVPVNFAPVTNGIFMDRWIDQRFMKLYREAGIIDQFDLPSEHYGTRVENLSSEELRWAKDQAKSELIGSLRERRDQYGQPIDIPYDAVLTCWAKRFAGYKRPDMFLADVPLLKSILDKHGMHILLSGRAHPDDGPMQQLMHEKILRVVDQDDQLRQRVHYIPNYDESLAKNLVAGVDIWCNTPIVGNEACGTSWEKGLGNLALLIATEDGGVADVAPRYYFRIEGSSYQDEVKSFYERLSQSGDVLHRGSGIWGAFVKNQLEGFIPTIAGGRMIRDHINFFWPKEEKYRWSKAA